MNKEMNDLLIKGGYLEKQLQAINGQLQAMQNILAENDSAIASLSALPQGEKELVIPIGMDVFLKVRPESVDSVIIGSGNRTFVEKRREDAIHDLEERRSRVLASIENLNRAGEETISRLKEIDREFRKMGGEAQMNFGDSGAN